MPNLRASRRPCPRGEHRRMVRPIFHRNVSIVATGNPPFRRLRIARGNRPRRHGDRLQSPPGQAEPGRGGQKDSQRGNGRLGGPTTLSRRGRGRRSNTASKYRVRSEERRGGEESRIRWSADPLKKKK